MALENDIAKRARLRDEAGAAARALGQRDEILGKLRADLTQKEAALNGLRGQIVAAENGRKQDTENLFLLLQELAILEEKMARSIDISPASGAPGNPGGPP